MLAATVLGSAAGFLDATVVNVALPDIGRDLDAGVAGLQWVVSGYTLTLGSVLLLGGALGDRYGRRRVFLVGIAWFVVASVLCAAAPSSGLLVGARLLQGVGAALLTPGSLALIQASFPRAERSRAIGLWSALSGVGAALGPVVGGYLVEAISWRAVFLLNVPIGVLVVLAALRHVPESHDPTVSGRPDLPGSGLVLVGLGGLSFALIEGPGGQIGPGVAAAAVASGLVALLAFVMVERRRTHPMLPLAVFSSRTFTGANLVTFAVYAALAGVQFLLVIHLQTTLGYSPLAAGAATLPVTVIMLLLSSRSGLLAQRRGPRLQLVAGPFVLAIGTLLTARIGPGDSYAGTVLPAVIVFGLGLATLVAPVTSTALAAVDERHAGVASGVNNAVSRVAGLAAVAGLPVAAGISGADFSDPVAMQHGFPIAMAVAAVLAAAGGLAAAFTIRNDVLGPAEPERPALPCHYHCAVAGTPLEETTRARVDADGVQPRCR
ncbi:MAG: MFS transporter [Marmoricola sp.]